jgi:hypothetical protein
MAKVACCGTGQANCIAGQTCNNNVCSTCGPPPANTYFVDPANGTTSGPSGANTNGCQFKTIAQALKVIRALAPTAATIVYLLGDTSAANGETFPLSVPAHVSIIGAGGAGGTTPTERKVTVTGGAVGFTMSQSNSGLAYLKISGDNGVGNPHGLLGVHVEGASLTAVTIDHSTVTAMAQEGVTVGGVSAMGANLPGNVTLGPGLHADANGDFAAHNFTGLSVIGTGTATIVGADGTGVTSFNDNALLGIFVRDAASITLMGGALNTATNPASGTITANNNYGAGLFIRQQPGGGGASNSVIGLLVQGNPTTGSGVRIEGGSKVVLHNSLSLGNAGSGVTVATFNHNAVTSDDVAGIDLGKNVTGADKGGNILQVPNGSTLGARNAAAGICLALTSTAAQTLNAVGNQLVDSAGTAAVDCSQTVSAVLARRSCTSYASVGIAGATTNNSVAVSLCNYTLP